MTVGNPCILFIYFFSYRKIGHGSLPYNSQPLLPESVARSPGKYGKLIKNFCLIIQHIFIVKYKFLYFQILAGYPTMASHMDMVVTNTVLWQIETVIEIEIVLSYF